MDQDRPAGTANKPTASGIPRPSKLPIQTSKLPVPRPTSLLRTTPSRETLASHTHTSNIGLVGSGTLRNPKLRATPSRDQLVSSGTPGPAIRPQPNISQSRAVSSPQTRPSLAQPAGAKRSGPRYIPQRPGNTTPQPTGADSRPGSAARVPRRQPSTQWISAASPMRSPAPISPVSPETEMSYSPSGTPTKALDPNAATNTMPARPASSEARPSLAERTIETLSRLPSSPSVRGKAGASSFFDPPSALTNPLSRPSSRHGLSRPGSSGSSQDRPGSSGRPGSSSGLDEGISNFKSTINAYKTSLGTTEATPLRNRRSIQTFQPLMPSHTTPGKTVRSSVHGLPQPGTLSIPRTRTPSPVKSTDDVPIPASGSKTLAARPAKRPSINGLFRKPSVQNMNKTGTDKPQKASGTAPKPSTSLSTATGTAITTDGAELAPPPTYRKTSAVLREQIAKAKAAKRAAAEQQQKAGATTEAPLKSPVVPRDTSFNFDLPSDPFNQRGDDKSQAKILQGRLQTARTSGRLNIAAMDLKEIPEAVLNMYNLDSIDQPGTWAESVDLTRFVAADNELETIADSVFPDVDPSSFADDEDSQGNIFAGLETLDLHGNKLNALPMGLRRLELLTSLNLVCAPSLAVTFKPFHTR